jgi:hypothetical protein
MDWVHSQALETKLVCPDCGLDFRFDPPRANLLSEDEDETEAVSTHRFYGVDEDGWLVGDTTVEFTINAWIESRGIDTTKPYGSRPTPKAVERKFKHGPFYITQKIVDSIHRQP